MLSSDGQTILGSKLNSPALKGIEMDGKDVMTDEQKAALKQMAVDVGNSVGARDIKYPEIASVLGESLQLVAVGELTPEDAMKKIDEVSLKIKR